MWPIKKKDTTPTATQAAGHDTIPTKIDPKVERITSLVSETFTVEGNMHLKEGAKIDGQVFGDIKFGMDDGLLYISEGGRVEGNIFGPRAIVRGQIIGSINISGRLIIAESANIIGDVSYGSILVEDGAQISGRMQSLAQQQKTIDMQPQHQVADNSAYLGGYAPPKPPQSAQHQTQQQAQHQPSQPQPVPPAQHQNAQTPPPQPQSPGHRVDNGQPYGHASHDPAPSMQSPRPVSDTHLHQPHSATVHTLGDPDFPRVQPQARGGQ